MRTLSLFVTMLLMMQGVWGQKMILHMKGQMPIEVQLSNVDSITFVTSQVGPGLNVMPPSIYVDIGNMMNADITGGMMPYAIDQNPDPMVAEAMINGSTLTIKGNGMGSTNVMIKDNSAPAKFAMVFITVGGGPGGLTATPPYVEMMGGEQANIAISGGTAPYSFLSPPDPNIASATINGSTVTVTGVGNGYTYVVVKDNSMPAKSVTIDIRIRVPFTTPGSMSFHSTVKNFAANGIFMNTDTLPTNTQGVGGYYMTYGNHGELIVLGYYKNNDKDWDVAFIAVGDSGNVSPGTFTFNDSMTMKHAMLRYIVGWNPDSSTGGDDMFENGYGLMTGSITISSMTKTSVQGTFSGMGAKYFNGNPMPVFPITITGGTFNAPLLYGEPMASPDRSAINRLLKMTK